jgi:tetratricopeptide (TPR) repeat protein
VGFALATVCQALDALGEWQRAAEYGERALDMARKAGEGFYASYSRILTGWLRTRQGRWEGLEALLDEGLTIAEHSRDLQGVPMARSALGDLELLRGRPQQAFAHVDRAVVTEGAAWVGPGIVRVYLEVGEEDRAEEMLRSLLKQYREAGLRYMLADALGVEALLRTRQGRREEAEADFAEALELAHSMGWVFQEGRVRLDRGIMRAQCGDTEPARTDLQEARTIFTRLGARPYLERTEQAFAELG